MSSTDFLILISFRNITGSATKSVGHLKYIISRENWTHREAQDLWTRTSFQEGTQVANTEQWPGRRVHWECRRASTSTPTDRAHNKCWSTPSSSHTAVASVHRIRTPANCRSHPWKRTAWPWFPMVCRNSPERPDRSGTWKPLRGLPLENFFPFAVLDCLCSLKSAVQARSGENQPCETI